MTSSIQRSHDHHALPSFPTRRSSDLRGFRQPVIFRRSDGSSAEIEAGPLRMRVAMDEIMGIETGRSVKRLATGNAADRKSTRLNSSHPSISYAVFCLKKKRDAARRPL